MSLEKMRKSIRHLLGIQSNPEIQQSTSGLQKQQIEQKQLNSDQILKNKFVSIQKKENKLNPYKFTIERLQEYNLTIFKVKDILKCPVISYLSNEQEKRINEDIMKKPRWNKEESKYELINIKPEDERKSFFFNVQHIKDENRQNSKSKQTAKKSQIQSRSPEQNIENQFENLKQSDQIITKSIKDKECQDGFQSGTDSISMDKRSETKFRRLKPESQEVLLIQDKKQISEKNDTQNLDKQLSTRSTLQKADVLEKQSESLIQPQQQQITTDQISEIKKSELIENKQEQYIESQTVKKIEPQIINQVQYTSQDNPFTQNIENQLFNPPWLNCNPIEQNQQTFNLFQQPLFTDQQSQNFIPFSNQQTSNLFSNQDLIIQQPNQFQNNQQSYQNFNLFNQQNQFQQQTSQQPLFQQQQPQQSLFQQQTSLDSLFQQPSTLQLFQQQPQAQSLFQQQQGQLPLFSQQSAINLFQTTGTQQLQSNQLFQQTNNQTTNLFANNNQQNNTIDLFSSQPIQNTSNLFQSNQTQQDSLFSLNTQTQAQNTGQQKSNSQSDRYKRNLGRQANDRLS